MTKALTREGDMIILYPSGMEGDGDAAKARMSLVPKHLSPRASEILYSCPSRCTNFSVRL